jgi:hypothetical protein
MNSFNPSQYSELSESSIDMSSEMVEKGHKNNVKVDMEKFEEMCKNFRDKKDYKIKKLGGEDKKNFDLVVNYVHMLYGTPFYTKLFERVRKHFKNMGASKPGTIGSYFSGCLYAMSDKENNMLPGCKVACAGSMPLPQDEEGWSFCDKAVIIGEKQHDGYVFSIVKPAEDDSDYDPCYVFVEGEFSGLSSDEKKNLQDLGCKTVKLVSYSGEDYKEICEKDVSEIDERNSEVSNEKKIKKENVIKNDHRHKKHDESSTFWVFIVFLILIILLLFLVYRYYKMKHAN